MSGGAGGARIDAMDTATQDSHRSDPANPALVHRIAAGMDGFPEGEDAAALGAALATITGADLILVAVQPDPLLLPPAAHRWKEERHEAEAMLSSARASIAPRARTLIETDLSIPRALHRVVQREHRDLLVMGSSRHGTAGRIRIGGRTRQLLCHFECPLAIAPRGYAKRGETQLTRIGVGYDGGPESGAALATAASLATAAGAGLEVLAVVDDRLPPIGWSLFARGGAKHPEWEDAVCAELERRRVDAGRAAEATGARAGVEVTRGRPADALLELSESVDLLVIGSRRWGPVQRLLLGTTGEALLHDAACPTIVVPRPTD